MQGMHAVASDDELQKEIMALAEAIKRGEHAFKRVGAFDTWTCTVDVTGWLDGFFSDWPSHIQDGLLKAVEQQCKPAPGEYVKIVAAKCYRDVPEEPNYLRVVVQAFPISIN